MVSPLRTLHSSNSLRKSIASLAWFIASCMRLLLRCELRCSVHIILRAIGAPLLDFIPTVRGYRFRSSPLPRLGRNDELKALAPSNTSSFPRRVFCARGLKLWLHSPRLKGWRSAESRRVLARHPLGLHVTRQARRLTRRLASLGGRSPPGAPPWRF